MVKRTKNFLLSFSYFYFFGGYLQMDPSTLDVEATASAAADAINEAVQTLTTNPTTFWDRTKDYLLASLPKCILFIIVLIAGMILIRLIMTFLKKVLSRSKMDPALQGFSLSILRVGLYILLGITLLTIISTAAAAGVIAAMGIFGLAISLAVKDSLSNLAGGLSVLFTRPFALGDYVSIGATEGNVQEIRLNYTVLSTVDNKIIHIPNGDVAKAQITNFTGVEKRRLDLSFSIAYEDNFIQAESIILKILDRHPLALKDPEPMVRILEHGASAIVLCCRVWVQTPDYWTLHFDLLEEVKKAFDEEGITIPYNQLDVHVSQQTTLAR